MAEEDAYVRAGARPLRNAPQIRGAGYDTKQQMSAADLEKKYIDIQRERVELDRLRNTPLPQPPQPRETAQEKARGAYLGEIGTATAKTEYNLPKLEATVSRALKQGAELVKHPGFEAAVGLPNPFKGGLGLGTVPGTPARGFMNRLGQVKGGAFLQAFESLKGAGAITEQEGTKAAAAMAAMETSTSENEFRAALQEYMNIIADGLRVARQQVRTGRAQIGATDGNPYSYEAVLAEQRRRAAARNKGR